MSKIFTSAQFAVALSQASKNGYTVLNQNMDVITGERPVTAESFRAATEKKMNYRQQEILGNLMISQTRSMTIDPRTDDEKLLGVDEEKVKRYDRKLVAFQVVVDVRLAAVPVGHTFGRNFYISSITSFAPSYPTQSGYEDTTNGVMKYETCFLESSANRLPDAFVLTEAQAAAHREGGMKALYAQVQAEQRALGVRVGQEALTSVPAGAADNDQDLPF